MTLISYAHHRFPPDVIRHAVWLYLRFTLSCRDVEEQMAERGLDNLPLQRPRDSVQELRKLSQII
jgi:transposase-like protein